MTNGSTFPTIFLGTPEFAVPSLLALCEANLAPQLVISQPSKRRSRRGTPEPSPVIQAAIERGLATFETDNVSDDAAIARMKEIGPALGIVVAFGQILRKSVLNLPRHGCINLHPSMLPKYRGAAPVNWAILDGIEESGITVMRLVRKLDAGPIILQQPFHIPKSDTSDETLARAATDGAKLVVQVVRDFAEGREIREKPQNDADATYAGMLSREHGFVDFSRASDRVWDQIRGVQPWPRAEATLIRQGTNAAERVLIWRAEPISTSAECPSHAAIPGTVVGLSDSGIVVECGLGTSIRLTELQTEGGRRMAVDKLLRGWKLSIGDRFVTTSAMAE